MDFPREAVHWLGKTEEETGVLHWVFLQADYTSPMQRAEFKYWSTWSPFIYVAEANLWHRFLVQSKYQFSGCT